MAEAPDLAETRIDRPNLFRVVSYLQSILAIMGIVLYGALNLAYARFYEQLGLSPDDVGLGYISTLVRSSGLLVILVVALPLAALLIWLYGRLLLQAPESSIRGARKLADYLPPPGQRPSTRSVSALLPPPDQADKGGNEHEQKQEQKEEQEPEGERDPPIIRLRNYLLNNLGSLAAALLSSLMITVIPLVGTQIARLPKAVTTRIEDVKQGHAVSPLRLGPLTILDVSAKRAHIEWVDRKVSAEDISQDNLLYLGQANDQLVLYDAGAKQNVVKLPSSSVILFLDNCASERAANGRCPLQLGFR